MKQFLMLVFALFAVSAFAQQQPVPEISFESVPNFFKYPFEMNLGDMASVAVNSKGHIYMLSRSNITAAAFAPMAGQILEFDKDGKFVREVAPRLYAWSFVHSIRIDKQDFIWVVDKGSDMVVKIDPNTGHVVMVFGRRAEASDENGQHPRWNTADRGTSKLPPPTESDFRTPTDVAWDSQGNAFISDGYVNSRIAVFSKDGAPIRSFGEYGRGGGPPGFQDSCLNAECPPLGKFNNPHSIAIDAKDNIYVADRSNGRTQVFDHNFNPIRQIRLQSIPNIIPADDQPWMGEVGRGTNGIGVPWSLCITPGPTQYLYIGDGYPGRVYKLSMDGKVLGMFGRAGHMLGQFGWIHGIACPSENELYIADENNFRVQKIILHPDKNKEAAILDSDRQQQAASAK